MLTYSDVEGSQACIEEQAAERAALLVQLASVEGEAEAARLRLVRVESELGVALSGRASDAVEKQQACSLLALLVQKCSLYCFTASDAVEKQQAFNLLAFLVQNCSLYCFTASDAVEKQQAFSLLALLVQKYLRYWYKSALTRTRSSWQRRWRESGQRGRGREVRLSASDEQSASRQVVRKDM
jgi:hypothetical protein